MRSGVILLKLFQLVLVGRFVMLPGSSIPPYQETNLGFLWVRISFHPAFLLVRPKSAKCHISDFLAPAVPIGDSFYTYSFPWGSQINVKIHKSWIHESTILLINFCFDRIPKLLLVTMDASNPFLYILRMVLSLVSMGSSLLEARYKPSIECGEVLTLSFCGNLDHFYSKVWGCARANGCGRNYLQICADNSNDLLSKLWSGAGSSGNAVEATFSISDCSPSSLYAIRGKVSNTDLTHWGTWVAHIV